MLRCGDTSPGLQLSRLRKVTQFKMPAMSPTMTQGNIGKWQVKEGDSFTTGDVLLTIETDKSDIDVEAQDDGILGRILKGDGTADVAIGENIALLAEEGDSKADLDAAMSESSSSSPSSSSAPPPSEAKSEPKGEEAKPSNPESSSKPEATPSTDPSHGLPEGYQGLLPSVLHLCLANNIRDPLQTIKPTGLKGLTKGDVLAYLGRASAPLGSLDEAVAKGWTTLADFGSAKASGGGQSAPPARTEPATPAEIRRAILEGMARPLGKPSEDILVAPDFDSILRDYLSPSSRPAAIPLNKPSSAYVAQSLPRGDPLRAVLEA